MYFSSFKTLALCAFAMQSGLSNAESSEKAPPLPCTAHSPATGSFHDLRPISLMAPDLDKRSSKNARTESWQSKGYDFNSNFTLNICAPVIEKVKDVVGLEKRQWQNVSAFYTKNGETFSIGQESSELIFRGRKLVLQYTNGSPCGSSSSRALDARKESDDDQESTDPSNDKDTGKGKDEEEEDDDEHDDKDKGNDKGNEKVGDGQRRKSTIISFLCEKEPLAQGASAQASFVGTDPDECAYFFEVRSSSACGGAAEPISQGLGPGGVFGIIALIAVCVYFIGGIMYQRSVAHARGWRQLPNYSLWAGIASFIQDMFIIATSSCARFLPSRRGYISVSANGNTPSRGRSGREDENRLIDQLDEEWDD